MNEIDALKKLGEIVKFSQDEIIFQQGEKGDCAYLVLKGKTAVILNSAFDGGEDVVAVIGEGDIVGEMALLEQSVRNATVKSLEDVIALRITTPKFLEFLRLNPRYTKGLLKSLCSRIVSTNERIAERMNSQ